MLTDLIIGLSTDQALDCFATVTDRLTSPEPKSDIDIGVNLEKLRALDGVREFPARVKCATLAWHALNSAMQGHSAPASTE